MNMHINPIIEMRPGRLLTDLPIPLTTDTSCIGIMVVNYFNPPDCTDLLDELPLPCGGIAIVSQIRLKSEVRTAVNHALSKKHNCPCRVFKNRNQAKAWLNSCLSDDRICENCPIQSGDNQMQGVSHTTIYRVRSNQPIS